MFVSYTSEQADIQIERLKYNFDVFFDNVDYVYEYTLLGGEPLVHKNIADITSYLGDKYEEKIGQINLISNGTIIPNNVWKDVVFPNEGYLSDCPKEHMQLCGHSTHSVADGKLYWCDPAFAAECFWGCKCEGLYEHL